jgi:hypothetical protein
VGERVGVERERLEAVGANRLKMAVMLLVVEASLAVTVRSRTLARRRKALSIADQADGAAKRGLVGKQAGERVGKCTTGSGHKTLKALKIVHVSS